MKIFFSIRRVTFLLLMTALMFILMSLLARYVRIELGVFNNITHHFDRLFDVNKEYNIPTLFSSVLLFTCTLLMMLIAHMTRLNRGPFVMHWRILALVFLFLCLDESVKFHEYVTGFLRVRRSSDHRHRPRL